MMDGEETVEQAKEYQDAVLRLGQAVESLEKNEGWEVFLALFKRKKKEIEARSDYDSLEMFRADRGAIEIVEGILDELKTFKEDGQATADFIAAMAEGEEQPSRGIMLIEAAEDGGHNREA